MRHAHFGARSDSRYTRPVSWRHRIAIVLLAMFGFGPVAATMCAFACESSSASAAAHHSPVKKSRDVTPPAAGSHIDSSAEQCGIHDAVVQPTTTVAKRADVAARTTPLAVGIVDISFETLHDVQSIPDYNAPPGSAPPTTTPLVLRV